MELWHAVPEIQLRHSYFIPFFMILDMDKEKILYFLSGYKGKTFRHGLTNMRWARPLFSGGFCQGHEGHLCRGSGWGVNEGADRRELCMLMSSTELTVTGHLQGNTFFFFPHVSTNTHLHPATEHMTHRMWLLCSWLPDSLPSNNVLTESTRNRKERNSNFFKPD